MEPSYTILGSDGKQYGPVTGEQMRGWAREGRIGGETQVLRSDASSWVPAATLPELELVAAGPAPVPAPANLPVSAPDLERRIRSGAGWFYWIAAFSIVNSILTASGTRWGFAFGLGVTALIDAMSASLAGSAKAVAVVLNLGAAGIVAMFGFFAGKGHAWAFIVGMILLGLDTALTGLLQMWISLAVHLFALYSIFQAFRLSRALRP